MLEVDDNTTRAGGEGDKVPLLHLQRFIPLVNRWDLDRLFFRSIPFFFSPKESTNTKHTASYQKYCLLLEMCWKWTQISEGVQWKALVLPAVRWALASASQSGDSPAATLGRGGILLWMQYSDCKDAHTMKNLQGFGEWLLQIQYSNIKITTLGFLLGINGLWCFHEPPASPSWSVMEYWLDGRSSVCVHPQLH